MQHCSLCPRNCFVDRQNRLGFCHAAVLPEVSSICVHKGEEPPISGTKGICNVFFAHCNLQCIFCQNYEISRASVDADKIFYHTVDEIAERISQVLPTTENMLGLVSASHYAHLVPELIDKLHAKGVHPTVVWNSNGYESVETLRLLAPYIDVYLPDFKYMDADLAKRYSNAADYPEVAQRALREMLSQMGPTLHCDERGVAFRGIIIRHLVLPGQVENSLNCLRWLSQEMGTDINISLMAQYFPPTLSAANTASGSFQWPDSLNRPISQQEYENVLDCFYQLGFHNGWQQELCAKDRFHPDFSKEEAFEV